MKRLLSGIRPTGDMHIGNYVGAIRQWIDLQNKYQSFFMVADYHAIVSDYDPKTFQDRIYDLVATYLASGLDLKKSIIFVQSYVPEHTELTWILSTLTPLGDLKRMTQFKEKAKREQPHNINAALFNYPILMTADIILYKAEVVPVGEDQVQHIELAREIVNRFNQKYGQTFTPPRPLLSQGARIMSLNNPLQKMSKSIPGSYIALTDSAAVIKKKIMSAVTDVKPGKVMSPGVKNLFLLLETFSNRSTYRYFDQKYQDRTLKYEELKNQLAEDIIKKLKPLQEKRDKYFKDKKYLQKVLKEGALKAREIAGKTLKEVKQKMGL